MLDPVWFSFPITSGVAIHDDAKAEPDFESQ